jgi:hypothetical protein
MTVPHVCRTSDGAEIKIGMWVVDYDMKLSQVTGQPEEYQLRDSVCWSCAGHHGHWWQTTTGSFDGSRTTTRGVDELMPKPEYTPLSRGFSCEVCDRGYAHNEVSHDGGETWTKVCDACHAKEMNSRG